MASRGPQYDSSNVKERLCKDGQCHRLPFFNSDLTNRNSDCETSKVFNIQVILIFIISKNTFCCHISDQIENILLSSGQRCVHCLHPIHVSLTPPTVAAFCLVWLDTMFSAHPCPLCSKTLVIHCVSYLHIVHITIYRIACHIRQSETKCQKRKIAVFANFPVQIR